MGYIFIFGLIISGIWLADSVVQWLPILGSCIGTYALFCLDGIKMRLAFVVGTICWLSNNIIVGSIGGTLLEATLLAVNCMTIWRLYSANKQARSLAQSKACS
jgi:hypothetical protein